MVGQMCRRYSGGRDYLRRCEDAGIGADLRHESAGFYNRA